MVPRLPRLLLAKNGKVFLGNSRGLSEFGSKIISKSPDWMATDFEPICFGGGRGAALRSFTGPPGQVFGWHGTKTRTRSLGRGVQVAYWPRGIQGPLN